MIEYNFDCKEVVISELLKLGLTSNLVTLL